jgi:hypothetical protein
MYSLLQPVKFWWQQNKTKMISKVEIKRKQLRINDLAKGELKPSVSQAGLKAPGGIGACSGPAGLPFGKIKNARPKSLFPSNAHN